MFKAVVSCDNFLYESPNSWGGPEIVSFNYRHIDYQHPEVYGLHMNEFGEIHSRCIGFRRRLETGTAFILSYTEHGRCKWSIGTDIICRFDTTRVAGVLLLDYIRGESYKDRRGRAEAWCEMYTAWCNGDIYRIEIENSEGNPVDSISGIFDIKDEIRDMVMQLCDENNLPFNETEIIRNW